MMCFGVAEDRLDGLTAFEPPPLHAIELPGFAAMNDLHRRELCIHTTKSEINDGRARLWCAGQVLQQNRGLLDLCVFRTNVTGRFGNVTGHFGNVTDGDRKAGLALRMTSTARAMLATQAAIEDLDTRSGRGVDPRSLTSLALGDWVEPGYSLLISGPTGAGKSWLACALAQYACRRGHSALYLRVPRLAEELRVLHSNGGFTKWLLQMTIGEWLSLMQWFETICSR
ncbi:hypothetical protein Tamer19_72250 [Cupriavidus sp. TA19]|nr:hypothetical protein Tamer19_72250 [Cupriavidus sp. TA19]